MAKIIKVEAENKNIQVCDLRYAKSGQEDDGAVTTILMPDIEEDKDRGHDESSSTVEKTIDTEFDKKMYYCDKVSADGTALDKDKGSPAQQLRDAFEGKYTQPGSVNFLIASGRRSVLHDPLGAKIDTDFMAANYVLLKKEKSAIKIQYQSQPDGSIIIINESFATYIDQKKAPDYANYQFDLEDKTILKKTKKPQTSLVYTRIVHKVEMENGVPKVSVIEKLFNVESENVKEANAMGSLLAKRMEIDFTPKASNPIVNFLSKVFRNVKDFALMISSKRRIEEPTATPSKKTAAGLGFFGSTSLREPEKPPAKMSISAAYKNTGFLSEQKTPGLGSVSIDPIQATQFLTRRQ